MISLYYQTDDPFSQYGIQHFIEKFGIPFHINNPSQSGIVVSYGREVEADFLIKIKENALQNHVCGKINNLQVRIPLCECPLDTGSAGEVIAYFEDGVTRYPCITRTKQGITIGIDIFKETGHLLSGYLDALRLSLDESSQQDLESVPMVDFFENFLFDAILEACYNQQIPLVQKSIWPEGKSFAVCLTHDIDEIKKTYQWISRPLRYLLKRDISGFKGQFNSFLQRLHGIEPYYTFDDIIKIEKDYGVKSTYFILKETGTLEIFSKKTWYLYGRNRSLQNSTIRLLIQKLQMNGDEVAIHGSYFSYIQPDLIEEQTRELEGIIHEKIMGSRQHNLNLEIPKTWEFQIKAGLQYDTSLGLHDSIGFRWGTAYPFFPCNQGSKIPLLELPLIIMDICLESGKINESDCIRTAGEVEKYHGVLTLLWHPPAFNTLEFPGLRNIYIALIEYSLDQDAWIIRARDILEWLTFRNQQTFSYYFENLCCTIIPSISGQRQFFTIYLPFDSESTVHVKNAEIIRKKGKCLYIRTHILQKADNIVVDFS